MEQDVGRFLDAVYSAVVAVVGSKCAKSQYTVFFRIPVFHCSVLLCLPRVPACAPSTSLVCILFSYRIFCTSLIPVFAPACSSCFCCFLDFVFRPQLFYK